MYHWSHCQHITNVWLTVEGDRGAGGGRETGEERAGSGISMMAGSGREIPKGKLVLIVTAHHQIGRAHV